jgi:catechol 2,3-dioxygenase-like lactoylglutathione lyase family enzyme
MGLPNGLHHLAIATKDIKTQIEFFTQACGMELVALYWMHGVPKTFHGFVRMGNSCIAFVQGPEMEDIEPQPGVSHAPWTASAVAPGAMQHLALNVDSFDDLLAIRDRLRTHEVWVWGPIDHGFCKSIYFAGPEGMMLEFSTSEGQAIEAEAWIDPEVQELCGINEEEVKRYKNPATFVSQGGAVPQAAVDPANLPMELPPGGPDLYTMSDEEVWEKLSETTPPVDVS